MDSNVFSGIITGVFSLLGVIIGGMITWSCNIYLLKKERQKNNLEKKRELYTRYLEWISILYSAALYEDMDEYVRQKDKLDYLVEKTMADMYLPSDAVFAIQKAFLCIYRDSERDKVESIRDRLSDAKYSLLNSLREEFEIKN